MMRRRQLWNFYVLCALRTSATTHWRHTLTHRRHISHSLSNLVKFDTVQILMARKRQLWNFHMLCALRTNATTHWRHVFHSASNLVKFDTIRIPMTRKRQLWNFHMLCTLRTDATFIILFQIWSNLIPFEFQWRGDDIYSTFTCLAPYALTPRCTDARFLIFFRIWSECVSAPISGVSASWRQCVKHKARESFIIVFCSY